LHEAFVFRAAKEGFDAVERIGRAAAGLFRFTPFVNQRDGDAEVRRNLLRIAAFKDFTQQFVGIHDGRTVAVFAERVGYK